MISRPLKVGVVGATGVVGQTFMKILSERTFPIAELRPFASESSLGKKIKLDSFDKKTQEWDLQILKPGCFDGLDLVFFSSGDDISRNWAPEAIRAGAFAVDNSAAFRMNPECHLIVPEVNGHLVNAQSRPQIIANPNCSTIQLVVALKPLADRFGVNQVRVATYQSVSGAGQPGTDELLTQTKDFQNPSPMAFTFPHQILFNVIPQIGYFNDEGFCSEEVKIQQETKKILGLPQLKVSAFTVRVPALNAHSEAVWVTLDKKIERSEFVNALSDFPGLVIQDDPKNSVYPLANEVSGKDPVFVGRIHRDSEDPNTWLMWVVSDNVRKGAALNGIQIAENIFSSFS